MTMTMTDWRDLPPGISPEDEVTGYTSEMKRRVMALVDELDGAEVADLGAELRVRLPTGPIHCFMGQPCAEWGRGQGTDPRRIAQWRDLAPVNFVAVQGDVGWLLTVTESTHEPLPMDRDPVNKRFGWSDKYLLKFAFTRDAMERTLDQKHPAQQLWRWDHIHKYDKDQGGLF